MLHQSNADEVRRIALDAFSELFGREVCPESLKETILIDEGKYRGRTYRIDQGMAMWFLDIGLVQFYDRHGAMLRTISLLDEQRGSMRRAA
ncbi:MAG TPA: hypothetical protein VHZ24_05345 [Pirellulales bacterium]|jgi:hypothetical protein|nr:hypothetical protein [Pirellulales bacterium]